MTQTRQISIDCRRASAPVTAVVAAIAVLALSGCSSLYNPSRESSIEYDPALLSGEAIFGEIVDSTEVPDEEIVGMTENMTSYMDGNVGERRLSTVRFHRLFAALKRDGYFKSTYAAGKTNTASETFETKSGNCLSYTNMFIALSRHAGLDASFPELFQSRITNSFDKPYIFARYLRICI